MASLEQLYNTEPLIGMSPCLLEQRKMKQKVNEMQISGPVLYNLAKF